VDGPQVRGSIREEPGMPTYPNGSPAASPPYPGTASGGLSYVPIHVMWAAVKEETASTKANNVCLPDRLFDPLYRFVKRQVLGRHFSGFLQSPEYLGYTNTMRLLASHPSLRGLNNGAGFPSACDGTSTPLPLPLSLGGATATPPPGTMIPVRIGSSRESRGGGEAVPLQLQTPPRPSQVNAGAGAAPFPVSSPMSAAGPLPPSALAALVVTGGQRLLSASNVIMSIADFDLLGCIGQGSYGAVHVWRHKLTGICYAVKSMDKRVLKHKASVHTVVRELACTLAVDSPFVCGYEFSMVHRNDIHMGMRMMWRGDLERWLLAQQHRRFDETVARFYAGQIALGLKQLHQSGVIHRDIKASNILIDDQGHLRITDFGLAVLMHSCSQAEPSPERICRGQRSAAISHCCLGCLQVTKLKDLQKLANTHGAKNAAAVAGRMAADEMSKMGWEMPLQTSLSMAVSSSPLPKTASAGSLPVMLVSGPNSGDSPCVSGSVSMSNFVPTPMAFPSAVAAGSNGQAGAKKGTSIGQSIRSLLRGGSSAGNSFASAGAGQNGNGSGPTADSTGLKRRLFNTSVHRDLGSTTASTVARTICSAGGTPCTTTLANQAMAAQIRDFGGNSAVSVGPNGSGTPVCHMSPGRFSGTSYRSREGSGSSQVPFSTEPGQFDVPMMDDDEEYPAGVDETSPPASRRPNPRYAPGSTVNPVVIMDCSCDYPHGDGTGWYKGRAGTPAYWCPQMITRDSKGERIAYGADADWWSFGCLVFCLMTGRSPFSSGMGTSYDNALTLEGRITWPKGIFSKEAKDFIARLLTVDPAKRLGSGPNGWKDVLAHPWFSKTDWALMEARVLLPPSIPNYRMPTHLTTPLEKIEGQYKGPAAEEAAAAEQDARREAAALELNAEDEAIFRGVTYTATDMLTRAILKSVSMHDINEMGKPTSDEQSSMTAPMSVRPLDAMMRGPDQGALIGTGSSHLGVQGQPTPSQSYQSQQMSYQGRSASDQHAVQDADGDVIFTDDTSTSPHVGTVKAVGSPVSNAGGKGVPQYNMPPVVPRKTPSSTTENLPPLPHGFRNSRNK
jgi:serine/threonine protein kinase